MGNIISTEFIKIKRYSVVRAGLIMMSLSVLMSCFYSTANTGQRWDFQYYIQQVIISNCTLFFPIIITLVAVYIISRESTDDTLKSLLTVPLTYKKLLISKFCLLFFLTVFFSLLNALLAVILNLILKFPGMGIYEILLAIGQIVLSNILIYISVLPIIVICAFSGGKSLAGVVIAFIYGYFATFEGNLLNWFPVKGAMIIADPNCGAEIGISYDLAPAIISLAIIFVISILLLEAFSKMKKSVYKKAKVKKKSKQVRRRGW